jgi:DNA-binding NarL/FixJ family response regulator
MADERTLKVLYIDDGVELADQEAWKNRFTRSTQFRFRLDFAASPAEIETRLAADEEFDLYIVDLELEDKELGDAARRDPSLRLGHIVVEVLARTHPGTPIIVYSCHKRTREVVRAVAQGAVAFIPKVPDPDPEQGHDDVYANLLKGAEDAVRRRIEFLRDKKGADAFLNSHTRTQVLGIIAELDERDTQPDPKLAAAARFLVYAQGQIRAWGATRFEALDRYRKLRARDGSDLPEEGIVSYDLEHLEL